MRPAQQTAATVIGWLEAGRRVAAGLLVGIDGSAPLDVGASMYVDADGTIEGSVTGGCVESAVAQEALAILAGNAEPRLITYGISDELAGTVGLMCGGTVHIFVHELRRTRARRSPRPRAVVAGAAERRRDAARRPARRGKLYVDAHTRAGRSAARPARPQRRARGARPRRARAHDGPPLRRGRHHARHRPARARHRARGAAAHGHLRRDRLLRRAGAHGLGPRLPRHDRRPAARVPGLAALRRLRGDRRGWPEEVLAEVTPGPRDAVLVFTHDPKLDVPALMAAFATEAGVRGRARGARRARTASARLREAGATDADLRAGYAPCGLDIGAATVEETAIACSPR